MAFTHNQEMSHFDFASYIANPVHNVLAVDRRVGCCSDSLLEPSLDSFQAVGFIDGGCLGISPDIEHAAAISLL